MSRIRILGASLIALASGTGVAAAADLYTPPPSSSPPPVTYSPTPAFSWNGAYAGLVGGYGWGSGSAGGSASADGWMAGAYAGYNFQTSPNWVLGLEGDAMWSGMSGTTGSGVKVENPWVGTFRVRGGYAMDRFLFYGTGGLAVGEVKGTDTVPVSQSDTRIGWTAGLGIEAAITPSMTARVEYRHTDLGSDTMSALAGSPSVGFTSDALLVGFGTKF